MSTFYRQSLDLDYTPGLPLRIALLCLVGLIIYSVYHWLLPRPIPGIPYNPQATRTLLGDIPNMMAEVSKTGDLILWMLHQTERLNSPLIQVFFRPLGKPILVLSDFREAQDVLLHRYREFDRSSLNREVFSGMTPNHHIHMETGPGWKAHRKLIQDLMTPEFLRNVAAPAIYETTHLLVDLWAEKMQAAAGRPFSAMEDIRNAALDAVLSFSYGKDFPYLALRPQLDLLRRLGEDQLDRFKDASTEAVASFPEAPIFEGIQAILDRADSIGEIKNSPLPALKSWFINKMPRLARARRLKDKFIYSELKRAVNNFEQYGSMEDSSWVGSAVDHVVDRERRLAEKEQRDPQYISPVLLDEIEGILSAGHDTTSSALNWGVKFLADNPGAQSRLRSALWHAFPRAREEGRPPSCSEIINASIAYLDATIEEILRCATTIPAIDREAIQDTVLLGHPIPKGTIIFLLGIGAGIFRPEFKIDEKIRSPTSRETAMKGRVRSWKEETMADFMPERWLVNAGQKNDNEPGKEKPEVDEDGSFVFDSAGPTLPFGGGLRGCFGRRLAYVEMRLLLTMIIWNYELHRCPKEMSSYESIQGLALKPKKCFVRLSKAA